MKDHELKDFARAEAVMFYGRFPLEDNQYNRWHVYVTLKKHNGDMDIKELTKKTTPLPHEDFEEFKAGIYEYNEMAKGSNGVFAKFEI